MQFEYPLSNTTREELQRFQRILELNDAETTAIEAIIIQSSSEGEYQKQQETIREQQEAEKQQQEAVQLKQQEVEKQQQEAVRLKQQDAEKQRQQEEAESRQKLQQYIQQPSRTQPTQSIQERTTQPTQERITRQKFLKWAGLGSVGLVTAVVGREIFKDQSPKYISFKFETVTVDKKGQVIKRDSNKQAKFFKEDLGNGIILEMVEIPAGSFKMGSPPNENGRAKYEDSQHPVNVPTFFIGKFEVTQEQYQQIMGSSNPSNFKGAKRPVEQVSWNDAVDFCKKLSQKTERKYRLPSEAEWEYACRAGTTTPFHFGETITTELANYNGDYTYASEPKGKYRQETTKVGSFPPNAFGLYDMHGNVWEWCQDTWHDSYKGAPSDGSAWIDNDNQLHMLRGGSWYDRPENCRSAYRNNPYSRDDLYGNIGFRVVCAAGRILL
ncbi:SUMF1/EgtB/PvdO family nonheme iron enzyme [Nostoc sp. LEGE 12447]|nr:SUMF1/EgtB/PvdO family nonheme iron enzyme [Nostoc sp. LEGE 12447]